MKRRDFLRHIGIAATAPSILHGANRITHRAAPAASELDGRVASLLQRARSAGAGYADVRLIQYRHEHVQVQNREVSAIEDAGTIVIALRVYVGGGIGRASFDWNSPMSDEQIVLSAVANARALGRIRKLDIPFQERAIRETWTSPVTVDPFSVPLKEKIEFLHGITSLCLKGRSIEFAVANLFTTRRETTFASTTGAEIRQTVLSVYPNFAVTAVDKKKGAMESRSSFLPPQSIGYEITSQHSFADEISVAIDEANEKIAAQPIEAGRYDVVIDPSHLWYVVDETLGYHLDPMNHFLLNGNNPRDLLFDTQEIGSFACASDAVSVAADNTLPNALASSKFDADGFPTKPMELIRGGIIRALPMSDSLSSLMNDRTASPNAFENVFASRNTSSHNLVLSPRSDGASLSSMIASLKKGILLKGKGSIVHNHDRQAFQATPPLAWLIEDGKITRMVRGSYRSRVLDFWKACTGMGNSSEATMGASFAEGDVLYPSLHSIVTPPAVFSNLQFTPTP